MACRNLEVFKEYQDIGPTSYPNPSFNTFQNLGLFHKNLDGKSPCPVLFVTILGLLKSTKISGLHRIVILGLARVKILGFFIRTIFLTPKTHGLLLLAKILGFLKSAKILGEHCDKIPGLTLVDILGYFLRTRFLTQKHIACAACQNLRVSKSTKILDQHGIQIKALYPSIFVFCFVLFCFVLFCFVFWLFHNYVFEAKNSWPIFVFVKILGFSKNGEILGLHCIKI